MRTEWLRQASGFLEHGLYSLRASTERNLVLDRACALKVVIYRHVTVSSSALLLVGSHRFLNIWEQSLGIGGGRWVLVVVGGYW